MGDDDDDACDWDGDGKVTKVRHRMKRKVVLRWIVLDLSVYLQDWPVPRQVTNQLTKSVI